MIPPVPAPAAPAPPGVHGGGAHPAGDPAGEHVGGERRAAERAVGHAHAGDAGHVRPVRAPPPPRTRVPRGRARRPRPFAGLAVTDVPPRRTPLTPDSRTTLVTRPRPIPAGSRPSADNRARVSCLLPWFHHLPSS